MNIAVFTDTYAPHTNGVNSVVQLEKKQLELQGHKVFVITVGRRLETDGETVFRIRSLPTIGIKTKQPFRIGLFDRARIEKFLSDKSIDLVHTHTEFSLGWLGYYYARKQKLPFVHTFHTMWEDYKDVYFVTRVAFPIGVFRTLLRNFFSKADYILTPTEKSKNYVHTLVPDALVSVVQNGIPFTPLPQAKRPALRKKYGFKDGEVIAFFAGRVSDEKRVMPLYRAYKIALMQNSKLRLFISGDGARLKDIQRRVELDRLQDRVSFTGFVNPDTIAELCLACDIATTASLSETSNMSLLEGLSSGLAIVARNDPCLSGVVTNGVNGFLCDDDLELVERVLELATNKNLLEEIHLTNSSLKESYSAKKHTKELLTVYQEALEDS